MSLPHVTLGCIFGGFSAAAAAMLILKVRRRIILPCLEQELWAGFILCKLSRHVWAQASNLTTWRCWSPHRKSTITSKGWAVPNWGQIRIPPWPKNKKWWTSTQDECGCYCDWQEGDETCWLGDVTREQVRSCNMYGSEQARDCTVDVLELYYTIIIWYYDTNILSYYPNICIYKALCQSVTFVCYCVCPIRVC